MIQFKDCTFTIDGTPLKGVSSFLDHALKNDVRITPEQTKIDFDRAMNMGYSHPNEALNSVNKRLGTDYSMLSEVPEKDLKIASAGRTEELVKKAMGEYRDSLPEQGASMELQQANVEMFPDINETDKEFAQTQIDEKTHANTRQRISDAILKLKIKEDSLYSLPFPPQIWNGFIDVIHASVMAGVDITNAIRMAVADLKKQGLDQDEQDLAEMVVRENTGLNDKAREKAAQYVMDGATDAQAMSYLKAQNMSEGVARAILGDAQANPFTKKQRFDSLEKAEKEYYKTEDEYLGNKEVLRFRSQQTVRNLQNQIRATVPEGKGRTEKANNVDRAIHLYLDLQRNPEHLQRYYDKLTPDQQKLVDLSQNLTPEQKQIAEDIKAQYQQIGLLAKNSEIIRDVIDNYVARAWDFGDKPATEQWSRFKTNTRHTIERTLDTIIEGYSKGYKLAIQGATNNLGILMQEIGNVIEARKLLNHGLSIKYETGETDFDGKPIMEPLFSTSKLPEYEEIKSYGFKKWVYNKKLEDYTPDEIQVLGRDKNVLISPNGTVMEKRSVYAPKKIARSLNQITQPSILKERLKNLTKFNRDVKHSILSFSFYHNRAFSLAHLLVGKGEKGGPHINPLTARDGGIKLIEEQSPELIKLIRGGLTIGRRADFEEGISSHQSWLDKQMDKTAFTKVSKDKMKALNEAMHKRLFETYGAGLKAFEAVNLYKHELRKNPEANPNEVAQRVASLINDQYGGINWDRIRETKIPFTNKSIPNIMRDPTVRHISSLIFLATDWTFSNLRFAKKAFDLGEEGTLYRKAWARVILRGAMITAFTNAALSFMDEQDGEDWEQAFTRRYKEAWEYGDLRWLMVDISPLYHWAGGDKGKKAYFSIFGAYSDPIKAVEDPVKFLSAKTAFLTKAAVEMGTGKDWQGKSWTTLDELLGMDDKGVYKKAGHNKKGIYHIPGEQKGGKLTGQFSKWNYGGQQGNFWATMPSFIGSQARGMTPIPIQNLLTGAQGENDWTMMIMNMLGTGVHVNKPKNPD